MSDFAFTPKRHDQILNLLAQQGKLTITDIVDHFEVSTATARRDLNRLAEEGKLRRFHGGAIQVELSEPEAPIFRRSMDQRDEKRRIGVAAANLITEGDTVFLGSGSTVLEVARNLRDKKLTVITNSLPIVLLFADCENIELIALGGVFRSSEKSFIGHITENELSELRADKVIIGIRAVSLKHGLTNDHLPETLTDRTIIELGQHLIIVADHTKFDRVSTSFVATLDKVDTIVTDLGVPETTIAGLREESIQVIQV